MHGVAFCINFRLRMNGEVNMHDVVALLEEVPTKQHMHPRSLARP
jgi:hypothetical protein